MIEFREQKKQQMRKAIVGSAIKLFTEKGFEHTTMDELARVVGVGKGTIYGYFKAKDEILLAYYEAELDSVFAILCRKHDEGASLVDQLVAYMMGYITFVTENRELGRIYIRESLFQAKNARLRSRDLDLCCLNNLGEILGRAKQRSELPEESDLLLFISHLHALCSIVLSRYYQSDITSLLNTELFLRTLVFQALHVPAGLSQTNVAIKAASPKPPQHSSTSRTSQTKDVVRKMH